MKNVFLSVKWFIYHLWRKIVKDEALQKIFEKNGYSQWRSVSVNTKDYFAIVGIKHIHKFLVFYLKMKIYIMFIFQAHHPFISQFLLTSQSHHQNKWMSEYGKKSTKHSSFTKKKLAWCIPNMLLWYSMVPLLLILRFDATASHTIIGLEIVIWCDNHITGVHTVSNINEQQS